MTVPAHKQAEAARVASEALGTLSRLQGIREEHRSLTDPQSGDYAGAVDIWNASAIVLPELPKFPADRDLSDAEIRRAASAIKVLQPMYEMRSRLEADPKMRGILAASGDADSGRAPGSPPRDEIRALIASGERQHDFDFPTSEEIRGLPFPDADGEVRAISDFANGTSLYISDFRNLVAIYARTELLWRGLATVVTSDNGRPLVVPQLTADVTVYTPGEGTAITPSDPTLASVTVTPQGFKALTYINREAWEDQDVNLTQVLARSHARAIGLAFGTTFTTAVLAGVSNGGTATGVGGNGTAVSTFLGYEDLIDLQYSRAAPYRAVGAWIAANGTIKRMRKFKDQQGQYLWPSEDAVSGQPPAFMGGAVWEDPYLAGPASATKSVIYGDATAGLLIKATPLRVEISSDYLFNTDQIAIKTVQRIAEACRTRPPWSTS